MAGHLSPMSLAFAWTCQPDAPECCISIFVGFDLDVDKTQGYTLWKQKAW